MRVMQKVRCKGFSMCWPVGMPMNSLRENFFSSSHKLFFFVAKVWANVYIFSIAMGIAVPICFLVSRSSRDKLVGRLHYRCFLRESLLKHWRNTAFC